jgi:hypothetical protein
MLVCVEHSLEVSGDSSKLASSGESDLVDTL